jgi:hypothetical protein
MLLTAQVIASKYLDDFYFKNSYYANVGGIPLQMLNQLEIEFLTLINFNSYIEQETF